MERKEVQIWAVSTAFALATAVFVIRLPLNSSWGLELNGTDVLIPAAEAVGCISPFTQDGVLMAALVTLKQASPNPHPLSIRNGFEFIPATATLGPRISVGDHSPPNTEPSTTHASVTLKLPKSPASWHLRVSRTLLNSDSTSIQT